MILESFFELTVYNRLMFTDWDDRCLELIELLLQLIYYYLILLEFLVQSILLLPLHFIHNDFHFLVMLGLKLFYRHLLLGFKFLLIFFGFNFELLNSHAYLFIFAHKAFLVVEMDIFKLLRKFLVFGL